MAARSVTVMAKNAFDADAIDTPLLILGPKVALDLLSRMPGVEAV